MFILPSVNCIRLNACCVFPLYSFRAPPLLLVSAFCGHKPPFCHHSDVLISMMHLQTCTLTQGKSILSHSISIFFTISKWCDYKLYFINSRNSHTYKPLEFSRIQDCVTSFLKYSIVRPLFLMNENFLKGLFYVWSINVLPKTNEPDLLSINQIHLAWGCDMWHLLILAM